MTRRFRKVNIEITMTLMQEHRASARPLGKYGAPYERLYRVEHRHTHTLARFINGSSIRLPGPKIYNLRW